VSKQAWIIAGAISMFGLAGGAAFAATAASPPDFAPNPSVGWVAAAARYLPPPGGGPGPVGPARGRRQSANNEVREAGAQALFAIGDLDAPILQPWAREQMRQRNERILAGGTGFSRQASCWPVGTPGFLLYPVQPVYIVQAPKEVVMIWQADHQVRHVYLNVPHSAHPTPSWFGESVGHYEGDTLVIDTIGISTRTFVDNFETPHTDQLHTVERFHMTNGGMTMEASLHVEDPGAFTTPWDAIQRYKRVEPGVAEAKKEDSALGSTADAGPILESSCAENPNGLFGAKGALPLPQTDHPDF
jgi:hypothetical protein